MLRQRSLNQLGGVYEAPEVKHQFRKAPPGFYKEALSYLIDVRSKIRLQMKNVKPKHG